MHIAHGVTIGKHCLFAAKVAIAGKTIVEDHVTLWGGGVNSRLLLVRAIVLGQSGVTKSIEEVKLTWNSCSGIKSTFKTTDNVEKLQNY